MPSSLYKIKKGDTLWDIARDNNTTVEKLAKANSISNPSLIFPGQSINIPSLPKVVTPEYERVIPIPIRQAKEKVKPSYSDYKIKRGDTLSEIAQRYGTDFRQLAKLNGISNPNIIPLGKVIKVPKGAEKPTVDWRNASIADLDDFNKGSTNIDKIHNYHKGTEDKYIVEDKKNHKVTIYHNGKPIKSHNSVTGIKSGTDDMTMTKVDENNQLVVGDPKNNLSTPAGIFEIKSTGRFHGSPSIQRGLPDTTEDHIFNMIPSSIHVRHVPRNKKECNRSTGCTGLSSSSLKSITSNVPVGARWYVLPEDNRNRFDLTGYGLGFDSHDTRKLPSYYPTGTRDIKDVTIPEEFFESDKSNSVGSVSGMAMNKPSKGTNVRKAIDHLVKNKEKIREEIGVSSDEYDRLLPQVLGIMGRESGYDDPGIIGKLGYAKDELLRAVGKTPTSGPFQVRLTSLYPEERKRIGVKESKDLMDISKGAESAMTLLSNIYKYQVPKYQEQFPERSQADIALSFYSNPEAYTGEGEFRFPYAKDVIENSKQFEIQYRSGGYLPGDSTPMGRNDTLEQLPIYQKGGELGERDLREVSNPTSAPIRQDPFMLENLPTQRPRTGKELLWDNVTNAAIIPTQFRLPSQEEYEGVRKGGWDRSKVFTDAASWGLVDAMTGKAGSKILPKVAPALKAAFKGTKGKKALPEVDNFKVMLKEFSDPNTSKLRKVELDDLIAKEYYGEGEMISPEAKSAQGKSKAKTHRINSETGNVEKISVSKLDAETRIPFKDRPPDPPSEADLMLYRYGMEKQAKSSPTGWRAQQDIANWLDSSGALRRTKDIYGGKGGEAIAVRDKMVENVLSSKPLEYDHIITAPGDFQKRLGYYSSRNHNSYITTPYNYPEAGRVSIGQHEFTHAAIGKQSMSKEMINAVENNIPDKQRLIKNIELGHGTAAEKTKQVNRVNYLFEPEEIYGRIMEVRHAAGIDPSAKFTEKHLNKAYDVIKDFERGDMGEFFRDIKSENIIKLANTLPAAGAAYAGSKTIEKNGGQDMLPEYAYGGKIPKSQIKRGTDLELEHTSNRKKAKKTAMDHFKEHGPDYYKVVEKAITENLPTYAQGGSLQGGGQVSFNPPVTISLKSGQIEETGKADGADGADGGGEILGGMNIGASAPGTLTGGSLPGIGQLLAQNPGLPETVPDTLSFQNGGNLPSYALGSWLKGAGGIAQGFPPIGTIVGTALNVAGSVADKHTAEVQEEEKQSRLALQEAFVTRGGGDNEPVQDKQMAYGGGLMEQGGKFSGNPIINKYDGNAFNHQQGPGGIPVDAQGTPSSMSNQSAIGLTEAGEVTWNGYVFSDKVKF